jgi:hypothetical protein
MRKVALLSVVVAFTHSAIAQVQSGTIIIINLSKDELVVAADSRGVNANRSKPPDDTKCKLAAIKGKTLFATGLTAVRFKSRPDDPVPEWDNIDVARIALESVDQSLTGQTRIEAIGKRWAELLSEKWGAFYRQYPAQVASIAEANKRIITYGIFVEAGNGEFYVYRPAILFNPERIFPIFQGTIEISSISSCGRSDESVSSLGENAIPIKICSSNHKFIEPARKHRQHSRNIHQWKEQELFTVWLAEISRDCDLTGHIGGPINALALRTDGGLTWLTGEDQCKEK